jgi:hypothetical protein
MNPMLIIASVFFLLMLTLVLYRWKKSIEASWIRLFEKEYSETSEKVDNFIICKTNYRYILASIQALEMNPYRDKEKMSVLKKRFEEKFVLSVIKMH